MKKIITIILLVLLTYSLSAQEFEEIRNLEKLSDFLSDLTNSLTKEGHASQ